MTARPTPPIPHPTLAAGAPGARRIAAIDIGSNSVRAIIADVTAQGEIRVVDEMKAAPRLSAGLDETGQLAESTMQAALEALQRMQALASQLGATRIECVATSATRDASNGTLFLERIRQATGLRARIISGEEEARLSFRSAQAHFDLGSGRQVVCDIGGGSLELALSADGLVERLLSVPFGAVRATETWLRDGTRRGVRRLRKALRDELKSRFAVRDWRGATMIGSGGTFTNLAGMVLARQRVLQAARSVHGTQVTRGDVEHLLDRLMGLSPTERLAVPGLNPLRADIIIAGLAAAAETMAVLDIRDLHVSAYGIREGLLLDAAEVTPQPTDPGEGRERSVLQFAERTNYEAPHAHHVRALALQLFDAIGPRLGCRPADRQTLADAALLHDIGYHISYDDHHKHAYHLISHARFVGVSPEEQLVMANVARYHRGPTPKLRHRPYAQLTRPQRQRVDRLSALLRIADGFDRGHVGAVQRLETTLVDDAVRIVPVPDPRATSMRLELWGASRKSAFLAELLGREVQVIGPDGRAVRPDDDDRVD